MKLLSARLLVVVCLVGLSLASSPIDGAAQSSKQHVSDAAIKKLIIAESIAGYDGPCACPYQRARNGSSCGKRSAYSRPGGEEPLCYPHDVTSEMVAAYRAEHELR